MTSGERESIVEQLALAEGVNRSVFEKYTDEQLMKRLDKLYGNEKGGSSNE